MMPWLEVVVHIDRDLDLWAAERLPGGSTVAELKAALLCRDAAGEVLREGRFDLRLPGGSPVSDEEPLTAALGELEVCDAVAEASPVAASMAYDDCEPLSGVEPSVLEPEVEKEEPEEPKRGVTLRTLSGQTAVLLGLQPDDTLLQLVERAAEALQLPCRELALCLGSRALRGSNLHVALGRLGIGDGCELTVLRQPAAGAEPVEYRVLQGPLFKKPGEEPAAERVVALHRPVTSRVRTTGRTWTGPSGGQWVELDVWAERPGWLLVHGPGFNTFGPLLARVVPGEEEPIALRVMSPVFNDGTRLKARENHLCDICVRPSQDLGSVKSTIAMQCPEYRAHKMQILTLEELAVYCDGFKRHGFDENDLPLSKLELQHGDCLNLLVFK